MLRKALPFICCASMAFVGSLAVAQEAAEEATTQAEAVETQAEAVQTSLSVATLDADGNLVGKVFAKEEGDTAPLSGSVTLSREGVVIDTVKADEDGVFSFANVEPGAYTMYGTAPGYVGSQTYDIGGYSDAGYSTADLGLSAYSPAASYESYSAAPCSSCASSCSTCGAGGGGFGGGGGGLGGGGLLGPRPLLRLGLIGGAVGIAVGVSGDDDDASPDGGAVMVDDDDEVLIIEDGA